MLEVDNLLKALNNNDFENCKNTNEDYNLDDVLKFCCNKLEGHKIRHSDGTENSFTFD